ncbi:putative WD repeat-containing protein [Lachnellula suecica]|uniref:Putative WD repeat-containing protein n=1 Tax=Lachnellula suecica TaxID=602035 RepID=A0A8T9CQ51_9HELO|nr:putative WD repeat-containing protein [Lachnellula suecica]
MSSFFTIPNGQKKRKRTDAPDSSTKKRSFKTSTRDETFKTTPKPSQRDDSISGSDDDSDDDVREVQEESENSSDGEEETAAERRLRLAERYLSNIRTEVDDHGFDAEEIDRDLIAERLQEDVAESKGRMYRTLAGELQFEQASYSWFKSNTASITSIATCTPYAYTVSKDLWLVKWRIQELPKDQWKPKKGKKQKKPPPPPKRKPDMIQSVRGDMRREKDSSYKGHTDAILTVAASEDGNFVVTGGKDRKIIVWDAQSLTPLRTFSQHRDAVTGLAFRRGTNQLYSSSKDRTVKVWSLNELAYVETLFGHQDEVVDIAALAQERCISVGARDRTARLWKVAEETQLVYRGGGGEKRSKGKALEGSMDRVAMIDDEMFVTGGDNGSICLWTIHKKKPMFTLALAHGVDPVMASDDASAETDPAKRSVPEPQPRWITSLATIPYSDVVLSGSWDGCLRAWRVSSDKKKLEPMGIVASAKPAEENGASQANGEGHFAVAGAINDISLFERGERGKDGVCVVIAVGKQLRMGGWKRKAAGGKDASVVFEIPRVA